MKTSALQIAGFCYTYNRTNNRLSEIRKHDKDTNGFERGEKYAYDSLYRLVDFKEGWLDANWNFLGSETKTQSWDIDGVGNWASFTKDGQTSTQGINNLNQYTSFGGVALAYDRNKNLTSDRQFSYQYDFLNRLISVGGVAGYGYDADGDSHLMGSGRRIRTRKKTGTATIFDSMKPSAPQVPTDFAVLKGD